MENAKNGNAKISILIPVYNGERYIERCLKSILYQSFSDYEVIIVDDGSVDSTEKIISDLVVEDSRFLYIKTENRGVSCARQEALLHATGEYVIFVDSDDWVEKDMLSDMYQQCTQYDIDGVCAGIKIDIGQQSKQYLPVDSATCLDALFFLNLFFRRKFVSTLTSYLVRRSLWNGFTFPDDISVGEDMAGLVYVLEHANKIYAINKAYYHYCQNGDSIVHSNLTQGKINAYYFEKKMQQRVLQLIPDCKNAVDTWYVQDKIYLLSAMGRSRDYRIEIVKEIEKEFREHVVEYMKSDYLTVPYKISMAMIAISGKLYYMFYKFIFHQMRWVYKWVSKNE